MRTQQNPESPDSGKRDHGRSGRILAGFIIILVGIALFFRQAGISWLPHWLFSWEMILIVVGLFIGAQSSFRNVGWVFPFFIGLFFLLDNLLPGFSISTYLWPVIIIVAGLLIMFGSSRHKLRRPASFSNDYPSQERNDSYQGSLQSNEEYIDSVSVFGGIKKNIVAQNFKGGDIVTIFGGSEYNFSHADIQGEVTLEVVQLFGGTRLVIPAHWEVKSEMVAILGSVEDKRPVLRDQQLEPGKTLILKGTSVFGGIDLRSY